jgi:hypothetical protein
MEVKWSLGWPHCLTGRFEANNLLPPAGNLIPERPAPNLVTTLAELPRLYEIHYLIKKQSKQTFSVQVECTLNPKVSLNDCEV